MTLRWRAPGRVNLIGEHTDYNDGFALPFAIDNGCTATVSRREDAVVAMRSAQRDDPVELALDDLEPGTGDWAAYVAGVVWALAEAGHQVGGVDIAIDSDVPGGAGLSSSAAVVCSVTTALDELFGLGLSADELLAVSRAAENDYVGAPTGGMDQLASLRCTEGNALFCDMRSLQTEQVPFDLAAEQLTVVVLDTRTAHKHADGEYRRRREGCERAAGLLGVRALRDVGVADLDDALGRLPDEELQRYVRHIVTENDRVVRTVELLRAGKVREIGTAMTASHASMRDDYRITTAQLDLAVDELNRAGAYGARMTGGGFGGCAIALIDDARVAAAVSAVEQAFAGHGFTHPGQLSVRPAGGAHRL
jgi:galactokinase